MVEIKEEILDFIIKHGEGRYSGLNREELKDAIAKHLEYGTAMIIRNKANNEITAVARWNWVSNFAAHILDVVIHKDYRTPRFLRYMLLLGKRKYPQLHWITYERLSKYPDRAIKMFEVNKLLKRK